MTKLRLPLTGAVVEVPDELVDRYLAAGWEKVDHRTRKTEK